jgi:hypothetical protein
MVSTVRDEAHRHTAGQEATERGIVHAVAYADVFDYPLRVEEIHRYLVRAPTPLDAIRDALRDGRLVPRLLARDGDLYALAGREAIIPIRRRRALVAAALWPRAARYGAFIGNLPFVRSVAVTGALAVDNVEPGDDIDYLVVAEPGRLWLCRALVILLVRLAARSGVVICPNYFLSERALELEERNLFTAHELVQMRPVAGLQTYQKLRQLNRWTVEFLPNADESASLPGAPAPPHPARALAEAALRTPLGGWLERQEMRRKVRKLSAQQHDAGETVFDADRCKGHFEAHGRRILAAHAERLRALGELVP